jgi:hypothetical protein
LQEFFTTKKLPYGAQYEISRLVSVDSLKYDNILFDDVVALAGMRTNREAAPATAARLKPRDNPTSSFEDESDGMLIPFLITDLV